MVKAVTVIIRVFCRRYVPELANFPQDYIFEPWEAPLEVQRKAGCVIGVDYPERIVIHKSASRANRKVCIYLGNFICL